MMMMMMMVVVVVVMICHTESGQNSTGRKE
jgi:hypothetical protein